MPNLFRDFKKSNIKETQRMRQPIKAAMIGMDENERILFRPPLIYQFMYNPNSKSDLKTNAYVSTPIPGLDRPQYSWSNGGERNIEYKLFLNAYEYGFERTSSMVDVPGFGGLRTEIAKLQQFLHPKVDLDSVAGVKNYFTGFASSAKTAFSFGFGSQRKAATTSQFTPPPRCLLIWGVNVLSCLVKQIRIEETMWNPALDPIRATADVSLLVDENSVWSEFDGDVRTLLATLGLVNVNPLASLPIGPKGGRIA